MDYGIFKNIKCRDFLTEMRAQSEWQNTQHTTKLLIQMGMTAPVKGFNSDYAKLKSIVLSCVHDIWLYTTTTEELLICISATGDFVEGLAGKALLDNVSQYNISETVLLELKSVFIYYRTKFSQAIVKHLNYSFSYTCMMSIPSLQLFSGEQFCTNFTKRIASELARVRMKIATIR